MTKRPLHRGSGGAEAEAPRDMNTRRPETSAFVQAELSGVLADGLARDPTRPLAETVRTA
jgi:hypothetical protein